VSDGELLVGVDGGNTKTIALVARADGAIVGAARAGLSDLYNAASAAVAIEEITRTVRAALTSAGATGSDVRAAAFSLAGADWPEDFELLGAELPRALGLAGAPVVVNDAVGAIRCGTPDGVGVAVVCGTYGVVGSRNRRGDVFHIGFWPDRTGAYYLGDDALRAVWREGLELGPPTALTQLALERYGAADALDLLHRFNRRDVPAPAVAAMAGDVLELADAQDPVAAAIVAEHGRILGDEARSAAAHVGLAGTPFTLVFAGGVLRHPASSLLADTIAARVPEAVPVRATDEPVVGALLLAFDRAGIAPERGRLDATMPPPVTFATAQ
jgi:N-acetylglucosamine kinase-like BadF-type ATPase